MSNELKRELWLANRRKGIGGSDAAAICGLSLWKTPLEVYLEKRGELLVEETQDMRRGTLLEPVVRQMYCDATGRTVRTPDEIIVGNPEWMIANVDGIADESRVLECKTARDRRDWGEPGSADIPIEYFCQAQHYLMVLKFSVADVAVMFGDFDFAGYEVPADYEFQELMFAREADFWQCVRDGIPPEPITTDDVLRRWPRAHFDIAVEADETDQTIARALAATKANIKALEGLKDRCESFLKSRIGENEALTADGKALATWKNRKGARRFDTDRFRQAHPELYEQFTYESAASRTFLLKIKENEPCLDTTTTITIPSLPTQQLLQLQTTEAEEAAGS